MFDIQKSFSYELISGCIDDLKKSYNVSQDLADTAKQYVIESLPSLFDTNSNANSLIHVFNYILRILGINLNFQDITSSSFGQILVQQTEGKLECRPEFINLFIEEYFNISEPDFINRIKDKLLNFEENIGAADLIDSDIFTALVRYTIPIEVFATLEHLRVGKLISLQFPKDGKLDTDTKSIGGTQLMPVCTIRLDNNNVYQIEEVMPSQLSYAEIIALAGDYFGLPEKPISEKLDAPNEQRIRFLEHYHQMTRTDIRYLTDQIFKISNHGSGRISDALATQRYSNLLKCVGGKKYYIQLLATNFDHFAPFCLTAYKAGHDIALQLASQAHEQYIKHNQMKGDELLRVAYMIDAFASHFLSDLFSAGHMRVPRASLALQKNSRGQFEFGLGLGGVCVNNMHGEDGHHGLLVQSTMEDGAWLSRGDHHLENDNERRLSNTLQASVNEVYETCRTGAIPNQSCVDKMLPSKLLPKDSEYEINGSKIKQSRPFFKISKSGIVKYKTSKEKDSKPVYEKLDKDKAKSLVGYTARVALWWSFKDASTADLEHVPSMDLEAEKTYLRGIHHQ